MSLDLFVIAGKSDIKEVFVLSQFSEGQTDVAFKIIPPQAKLLCTPHFSASSDTSPPPSCFVLFKVLKLAALCTLCKKRFSSFLLVRQAQLLQPPCLPVDANMADQLLCTNLLQLANGIARS